MRESYEKDLASHLGLEPYAGDGNIPGVASGERYRQAGLLSSEIIPPVCRPCDVCGKATRSIALVASGRAARRSRRTCACLKTPSARTGRSRQSPLECIGAVRERPGRHGGHVHCREVRRTHSTDDTGEQTRVRLPPRSLPREGVRPRGTRRVRTWPDTEPESPCDSASGGGRAATSRALPRRPT